jgi:hypothetical protein
MADPEDVAGEPPDDDDDPEDDLPVSLPSGAVAHNRFSPAAIDYSVNKKLQGLIPAEVGAVVLDVKVKRGAEEFVLTGIVAAKIGDRWGLVLAGSVDLMDRHDYEIEILAVHS